MSGTSFIPGPPDDASRREAELIRAIADGQTARFAELIAPHQDRLYAVCVRLVGPREAGDLCQDAIVKVIQGIGSFDGSARFSTWITRIAMNVCLSYLRGQRLRRHASLDAAEHRTQAEHGRGASGKTGESGGGFRLNVGNVGGRGAGSGVSAEPAAGSGVEQREVQRRVLGAMERLADEQRAILVLRDVRGLDYEQIAVVLEVAVGTVKSRLFRARAALRELIEEDGGE